MNLEEFLALTEDKGRRPSKSAIQSFEKDIGAALPADYRAFLERCNGGYVGGSIWFAEKKAGAVRRTVGVQHVGGLRRDEDYSLKAAYKLYQVENRWIPLDLLWIMDDPFGNATCIGVRGAYLGKIYFWDHEAIPSADAWDGGVETAGNVTLTAPSFGAFLDGCVAT